MIRNKIGYPEKWRDYSALEVNRDDLIGNMHRDAVFQRNYNLNKLGKPVDEKEWGMTPPTVNAYYDPSMNDINFPAGILQPPFFDFSHRSRRQLRRHRRRHRPRDDPRLRRPRFEVRRQRQPARVADRRRPQGLHRAHRLRSGQGYGGFEAAPAHDDVPAPISTANSLWAKTPPTMAACASPTWRCSIRWPSEGKSIDDKIDGYTEAQRYFLGFAQVWCQNQTEQSARQSALTDPHSPGRWRVNGSVQNFDEFGKAFGCTKGQPMYPGNSCRVWYQTLDRSRGAFTAAAATFKDPIRSNCIRASCRFLSRGDVAGISASNAISYPHLIARGRYAFLHAAAVQSLKPGRAFHRRRAASWGEIATDWEPLYLDAETRHNKPSPFTMHQGPIPTQLCCGISTLGGSRLTRMKESHEVQEIRQGTSDDCPLCWRGPRHLVLRAKLYGRLSLRHRDATASAPGAGHHQRLQNRPQYRQSGFDRRTADQLPAGPTRSGPCC